MKMTACFNINYTEQQVLYVQRFSEKLMIFKISRPEKYKFVAGQFARIGFKEGNGFVWRAFSMMSAEYENELSFLAVLVKDGKMSEYLAKIKIDQTILLDKYVTGFLLPQRFEGGHSLLMIATGSGIAPFISQLQNTYLWERFEHIYLVHSVSYEQELVSLHILNNLKNNPITGQYIASSRFKFIPVITREKVSFAFNERIPQLLESEQLQSQIQFFDKENMRIMICGNPKMVQDTFSVLLKRGFTMHRNKIPGNIIMENGF